jgi:Carboxypeptidase regulatory-like domain/TonB-dependent Receptor Plug Domain
MRLSACSGIAIAIAVVLSAGSRGALAQGGASTTRGMMDGIVTDTTFTPIAGATISLIGSRVSATTGANGRFRITALPAGEYVVVARRLGYASASATLHLDGGDTLRPSFSLHRVTPELGTVRASAVRATTRLGEFEERRARKVGHFLTEDEIDRRNPISIADMLRSVLSVQIEERGPARKAFSMRSVAHCPFQIFVDGLIFSDSGTLTNAPSPKEIAGVEIYSGPATVPLEYKRHDTMCGVILIWTKGGE